MKKTIINHLAFLQHQGSKVTGTHQSAEHTKVHFMSCGCVVLAQTTAIGGTPDKYPLIQHRHYTTACKNHLILRSSNLSFAALQAFAEQHSFDITVNKSNHNLWFWLRDNYYTDSPIISEVDYNALMGLTVNGTYTTIKAGTDTKLKFQRLS